MPTRRAFFNRIATVGLQGGFGTLALGHQPDLMFDWVGKTSNGFLLANFYAFHPGNFDVLANTFQYDNAVRYNSPGFGGLTLGGIYGFGESAAGSKVNRNTSIGANYLNGPLRVAAAYSEQNNRTLRGFAPFAAASGLPATGVMDKVKNAGIGASYRVGELGLNTVYTQSKMKRGARAPQCATSTWACRTTSRRATRSTPATRDRTWRTSTGTPSA